LPSGPTVILAGRGWQRTSPGWRAALPVRRAVPIPVSRRHARLSEAPATSRIILPNATALTSIRVESLCVEWPSGSDLRKSHQAEFHWRGVSRPSGGRVEGVVEDVGAIRSWHGLSKRHRSHDRYSIAPVLVINGDPNLREMVSSLRCGSRASHSSASL
jgi:hypothetical protein